MRQQLADAEDRAALAAVSVPASDIEVCKQGSILQFSSPPVKRTSLLPNNSVLSSTQYELWYELRCDSLRVLIVKYNIEYKNHDNIRCDIEIL